ncbi:MAG: hypothetical protein AAF443_04335 [Chlamydiota bacterium]
MSQLSTAYQEQEKNQDSKKQQLFDACTVDYSKLENRKLARWLAGGDFVASIGELWALGCRLEDLRKKDLAFAEGLEEEAKRIAKGKKGKCDSCTDYLLLGAAEYNTLLAKQSRYEEYHSQNLHMNEFEDEEPYESARHSFQQYDQDGDLGIIFDPCEIFADEPEQKYIEDDFGDQLPLVSYKWYREDRGQQDLWGCCQDLFSWFFQKKLDDMFPSHSPDYLDIKEILEGFYFGELSREDKAKAACLLFGL